jgi:hypothetical protein
MLQYTHYGEVEMTDNITTTKVKEGWTGPGKSDSIIVPLKPEENGLHINVGGKGKYEWWYFDAHLNTGHSIVVFFHAANPNPGMGGKPGIEIVLHRPDGTKLQKFIPYKKSDFSAARGRADVKIGVNYLHFEQLEGQLPRCEIYVKEKDISCRLTYTAEVNGWKAGDGLSYFGKMGYMGWVIPFARARVEGTVTEGDSTLKVTGTGYHDHNWLNFPFPMIIKYWMWGRVYSEHYTACYAFIQLNEKMDNHQVKVLMLADGREVILSTGEFDFIKQDFEYNTRAKYSYPRTVKITVPNKLDVSLNVERVLEAEDMLENFAPVLRFVAKNVLRLKPGYFRLLSNFEIKTTISGKPQIETGTTLHEIVLFKSCE